MIKWTTDAYLPVERSRPVMVPYSDYQAGDLVRCTLLRHCARGDYRMHEVYHVVKVKEGWMTVEAVELIDGKHSLWSNKSEPAWYTLRCVYCGDEKRMAHESCLEKIKCVTTFRRKLRGRHGFHWIQV